MAYALKLSDAPTDRTAEQGSRAEGLLPALLAGIDGSRCTSFSKRELMLYAHAPPYNSIVTSEEITATLRLSETSFFPS